MAPSFFVFGGRDHRASLLRGHLVDVIQLLFDDLGEQKRVQRLQQLFEAGDLGQIGLSRFTNTLEGGLGSIVELFDPGADPDLLEQLHRRLKEVLEKPQFVLV